jgi:peroxiredoxin
LDTDLNSFELTRLSGSVSATDFWSWLIHEPNIPRIWATTLPVLLVLPAGWLMLRRTTGLVSRVSIALALGPVFVAFGFAGLQLSWWNQVDVLLLALLAATTTAIRATVGHRFIRWLWIGLLATVLVPGAFLVFPRTDGETKNALGETEIWSLVERDLARWLALHVGKGNAVILAPNNQAVTLYYFGGLRGLATVSKENMDGLGVAVRILSASTPEEAKELIDQRGVTQIVIPSWDSYLEVYTRMGMGRTEGTFYELLMQWRLPPWLKPVPYEFPTVAGLEKQSITILEVVENQDDATAASWIAEYFLEMGQLDRAATAGQALRRYPADLGALTVRAEVESARGAQADFDHTFESLLRRLAGRGDRGLTWDRRVSLAVVLARNKRADLAREQVRQCLAEVDEAKLRSLTTGSLYRLQVLGKAYGLPMADQHLRQLALDLLPAEFSNRLAQP